MRSESAVRSRGTRATAIALLFALGISLVPVTGCVLIHRRRACAPAATVVYVDTAPPALVVETKPPRPTPTAIWIDGYWQWNGHKHIWVAGHWDKKPKGNGWVPGRWDKKSRGWVWTPGHW